MNLIISASRDLETMLQGTHEELLAKGGKYAELWNMQLHSTKESKIDSSTSLPGLMDSDVDNH